MLQFEQLIVKENSKSSTKFQKNYFSEETDPEFNENFEPSKAVIDLKDYMRNFINKLKQTMIQSKAMHFSHNMADLDSQSFDIQEAFDNVRHLVTVCMLDLLGNLFLDSEQELKVKYGASMMA